MPEPTPELVIVLCQGCEWRRQASGKLNCDRAIKRGQRHADQTGHLVAVHHQHTTLIDLNETR